MANFSSSSSGVTAARYGVGHIYHGRYASGCRRCRFGSEIAFVRQARIAEMHVGVNHAWYEIQIVGSYQTCAGREAYRRVNAFYYSIADEYVALAYRAGIDYIGVFYSVCFPFS